jgi:lathosterol oxidase
VPQKLVDNMKEVAHHAFPLYIMVPILTDWFMVKGWSMACEDVQECGGPVRSVLGCLAYFLALELLIFVDHYYLLHKWDVGKRLGQHAYHHVYKYADQLNAFSGYSFAPQDGFSQGLALALCTLVVPVPIAFVYSMEVLTGLWTLYIHSDVCPLPWPMMGCDYHYIHHRYNWYNFGFMTVGFDTLFRTVKHPKADALSLALGQKPMPDAEKRRSAELTEAILLKRGREALSSDDAAGHARPLPAWLQEQVQAEASGGHEKAS